VSPVVATLILILIAVAAAAALYLWLVAWQGNITGGIGQPGAQYTVKVGGSTSVYPFSNLAASWFDQNNSDVVIADSQGGTGAGMLAVCEGHIDVGAASSPQTVAGLISGDNCPASGQITITTIAYDAVDPIIATTNTHGLQSISADTLLTIYIEQGGNVFTGKVSGYALQQEDGAAYAGTAIVAGAMAWNQIPAAVSGAAFAGGYTEQLTAQPSAAGNAGPAGILANDIVCTGAPAACTAGTPCGWSICAGTLATGANVIKTYERSDTSGTEQTFTSRLLAVGNSGPTVSGLGFGGCGSDGQLASCGLTEPGQGNGNPAVIAGVAGSADAIGFASDGLARAAGSGVTIVSLNSYGQLSCGATTSVCVGGAVEPSLGASGTIAAGITSSSTVANYAGWRPFEFVTLNPPTGEVQRYIQFITDPANNIELATVAAEISIYSV